MEFCLARRRGQEKIEDGLAKKWWAEMIESEINGQSECGMRGGV